MSAVPVPQLGTNQQLLSQEHAPATHAEGLVLGVVQEQKSMRDDFSNARDEDGRQAATKAAKRKARIDFGLQGSTY